MGTKLESTLTRYVCVWLTGGRFRLRLRSRRGCCVSGWGRATRGLPQGGDLSPFLWLIHFDPLADRMARLQEKWPLGARDCPTRTLEYADDVAFTSEHHDADVLVALAEQKA